jgi:hypothetical protein
MRIMDNRMGRVASAEANNRNKFRGKRPLPKEDR